MLPQLGEDKERDNTLPSEGEDASGRVQGQEEVGRAATL